MFAGALGDRGLLLLPPLLPLPQVGRGALGSCTAGRVCARRALARAHPCPHRWRWASGKAAATPRISKWGSGGGSWGLAPPWGRLGQGGRPGPASPAPSAPVPADARPRPAGAACGTWGKWRPRRAAGCDGSPPGQAHQTPTPPGSTAEASPALSPSWAAGGKALGPSEPGMPTPASSPSTRGDLLRGSCLSPPWLGTPPGPWAGLPL